MLDVPLDVRDWLVEYRTTSLEARYKYDLYPMSSVLSLPLGLVDPQYYTPRAQAAGSAAAADSKRGGARRPREHTGASSSGSDDDGAPEHKRAKLDSESDSDAHDTKHRRHKHRRHQRGGSSGDEEQQQQDQQAATAECVADAIEDGFAEAAREDVAQEPKLLQHPTKPGVYALDVMPVVPCAAVEGLNVCTLYFDADPLDGVAGAVRPEEAGRAKRELASRAVIARVGEGGQTLAVAVADPPRKPVEDDEGRELLPYETVRLYKQRKHGGADKCREAATKHERTLALLVRKDAAGGAQDGVLAPIKAQLSGVQRVLTHFANKK